MKLLFCKKCLSLFSLSVGKTKTCDCGDTTGRYLDDLNAVYSGKDAVPVGFANMTFIKALHKQPDSGMGAEFTAFIIPKKCDTFEKLK